MQKKVEEMIWKRRGICKAWEVGGWRRVSTYVNSIIERDMRGLLMEGRIIIFQKQKESIYTSLFLGTYICNFVLYIFLCFRNTL